MEPFRAKKSLGQNFLKNPQIATKIAEAADIEPGETIFEIGPGTGMLTRALLDKGAQVVALEADIRAVEVLRATFPDALALGKLTLIHGDIRTTAVEDLPLPETFSVAANIPYYLSGMLFSTLLSGKKQPKTLVFLVQKEVALRVARDKKESILSLSIKVYGTPSYEGTVTRGNFSPQPKVDSAILKVRDISRKRLKGLNEALFFKTVKAGMGSRRKQLAGNLASTYSKEAVMESFIALSIPTKARGEDLSIDTWIALATRLNT